MIGRILDKLSRTLLTRRAYRFFVREWLPGDELRRASGVLASLRFSQVIAPLAVPPPAKGRMVVIAPHPDDESIGPGGTLALAAERGCEIKVVFLSDGPEGIERRSEAHNAVAALGATAEFLGWPTRNIPVDDTAQRRLADAIDAHATHLFLPFLLDDHDDHRRASELLLAAVNGKHLHGAPEIWAYQVYTTIPGNAIVDITAAQPRKDTAIRCYTSQMAKRDWAHFARGSAAMASRFLESSPAARFAEIFFCVPLDAYVELCRTYFGADPKACYLGPGYRER
jgi:LmbE family N-acetylglucosaminyl deacetylase